jgi:thiamine-monophosphate kinase
MQENVNKTSISALGEFGLIDHITKHVKLRNSSSIKGIGDDCAVIKFDNDKQIVVTTDLLVEGIHFDVTYTPLKHLGYKSVVVNLSDVYAMNAQPRQITVSLAFSSRYTLEAIEELYSGILLAAEAYGVDVVGGDTTSATYGLSISITAIGEAKSDELVYRSGAQEHDLIVVSGDLGAAYMGLQILNREKEVWKENPEIQPDLDGNDYVLERQLKPEARKDVVSLLQQLGVKPTSMIDISDGLASEIKHICKASSVGAKIYEDKLPIDPQTYNIAREFNIDPTTVALSGGEDYELLMTIAQADFDKIKGNPNLTVIGHITKDTNVCKLITKGDSEVELKAQGWDSFKS